MAHNTLEFAKSQLEWMNDTLIKELELSRDRDNPFSVRCEVRSLNCLSRVPDPAGRGVPTSEWMACSFDCPNLFVGCQANSRRAPAQAHSRKPGTARLMVQTVARYKGQLEQALSGPRRVARQAVKDRTADKPMHLASGAALAEHSGLLLTARGADRCACSAGSSSCAATQMSWPTCPIAPSWCWRPCLAWMWGSAGSSLQTGPSTHAISSCSHSGQRWALSLHPCMRCTCGDIQGPSAHPKQSQQEPVHLHLHQHLFLGK